MSEIELFLDNKKISWEYNVCRMLSQPQKYEDNPIIKCDYPWEKLYVTVYGTVLPGDNNSGLRMWYQSGAKGMQKEQFLCYAESNDGFTWRKPLFNLNSYENHLQTNILLGMQANIHGPCVVRNEHDDNPSEKYLLFFDSYSKYRPHLQDKLQCSRWCYTATSSDGIVWRPNKGRPAVAGKSDTGQSVVWNPDKQCYIAYMRGTRGKLTSQAHSRADIRVRYVRTAISSDFLNWSEPTELLRADIKDGDPYHQIHQFSVTRRGNQYIGLLSMFHIDEYVKSKYEDKGVVVIEEGVCDTQLAISRNGFDWHRIGNRKTFLSRGNPEQWDSKWLTTSSQIVFYRDKMFFYYASTDKKRSEGHRYKIGVATLATDRFQSIKPKNPSEPAIIETKPLYLLESGDLYINLHAPRGKIVAELCDFNGKVIKGFDKDNCNKLHGDCLKTLVQWKGRKLSDAIDNNNVFRRALRIRFYIYDASLYAMYLPACYC